MTGAVPKLWPGATVAILAGGPSLRTQSIDSLFFDDPPKDVKVITVNDSWRLLPQLEFATSKTNNSCAAYFCDTKWWQQSMAANSRMKDGVYTFHDAIYKLWWFSGSPDFVNHPQVNALQLTGQTGLEPDPTGLRHGSNSGYQAINLAVHMGASRIVLLGFDMKADGPRKNWHDEHRTNAPDVYEKSMLPHFKSLVKPLKALGVEVVNATPGSALACFPKATLEEALAA